MAVKTKILVRRDTAANWTSTNPTLASGEYGYETDTRKGKYGDGSTAWTSLAYSALVPANNLSDLANAGTARTNLGLGSLATLSTITTSEITDGTVANGDLANMTAKTVKMRHTNSTGAPEDATMANLWTDLSGQAAASVAMNTQKFTGLAAGSANGDSVRYEQSPAAILTTTGDTMYASGANTPARLGIGTAFQVQRTNSGATAPEWVSGGKHLIAETILGSSAANFDFTSIPAGFRHLFIEIQIRSDVSATSDVVRTTFNNDTTAANYDLEQMQSNGSTTASSEDMAGTNSRHLFPATGATSPANQFCTATVHIPHYAGTANFKQALSQYSAWLARTSTNLYIGIKSMAWANTAAINRITFTPVSGSNFVTGSRVALYGIG